MLLELLLSCQIHCVLYILPLLRLKYVALTTFLSFVSLRVSRARLFHAKAIRLRLIYSRENDLRQELKY